jgi:hypothetical protein
VIGAAHDKLADLRTAIGEGGVEPIGAESDCGWVSLVGETGAVREQAPLALALLAQQGIDVLAHEATDRRYTVLVPDTVRDQAARLVHASAFERV